MKKFDASEILNARLAELSSRISDIENILQQPLAADFEEQANDLEVQDSLTAVESAARREVKAILAALLRIKNGNYGVCIDCGDEIPQKRLEAVPTALRCLKCENILRINK